MGLFSKKAKPEKKPVVKQAVPDKKKVEAKKKAEASKKAPAKKAPAKKEPVANASAKKAAKPAPAKKEATRTYHVVKRSDGKWEVKFAGGQKAIKLFDTQKEALEYSKVMAKNQGGSMLVHNSKGANKGRIKSKK